MPEWSGRCSCGAVQIAAKGEPVRVSICHCTDCQRRTGSVFGAQARFDRTGVEVTGETHVYRRTGDSGDWVEFQFCPYCASTVAYTLEKAPEHTAIPVGVFADPRFPAPRISVYGDRRHPWVAVPDACEQYD